MPRVGLKPTIPVCRRLKTMSALNPMATGIGSLGLVTFPPQELKMANHILVLFVLAGT
jgi:ABC-type multidrug transport system permease subunit